MQKTYKECDKCQISGFGEELSLYELAVSLKPADVTTAKLVFNKVQWCRECAIITGLLAISDKETEERRLASAAKIEPVTMEDIIREIAEEVITNTVANSRNN